jgi:hypothetical protein
MKMRNMTSVLMMIVLISMTMTLGQCGRLRAQEVAPAPAAPTVAELQGKMATVEAQLKEAQAAAAKAQALKNSPVTKGINFGEQIGHAMQELVKALDGTAEVSIERINQFAETRAGKYAMIALGWKIFGRDIVKLGGNIFGNIMGIVWMIALACLLKHSYRRMVTGWRVLDKVEVVDGKKTKIYKTEPPLYDKLCESEKTGRMDSDFAGGIYIWSWVVYVILALVCIIGMCCSFSQ